MVYFLVIDTVLFLSAWCKPKQSKILFGIAFFMLWFVMAFRNVNLGGSDAYVYQEWFYTAVPKLSQFEFNPFVFQRDIQAEWGFGWLFTLLASFIKTFAVDYIVFQVFYVTLSFLLLAMILHDMELTVQENRCLCFPICRSRWCGFSVSCFGKILQTCWSGMFWNIHSNATHG